MMVDAQIAESVTAIQRSNETIVRRPLCSAEHNEAAVHPSRIARTNCEGSITSLRIGGNKMRATNGIAASIHAQNFARRNDTFSRSPASATAENFPNASTERIEITTQAACEML